MALTDKLTAIADGFRTSRGTTDKYTLEQMAVLAGETVGSDPVIESLEITSNGTYTATECDGYSPITVNVPQDGAPTDEELTFTGKCNYAFAHNKWNWIIEKYGNRITTKDINRCTYMFSECTLEEIPFQINITNCESISSFIDNAKLKVCPKIRGTFANNSNVAIDIGDGIDLLNDVEDLFTSDMLDWWKDIKCTSKYSYPKLCQLPKKSLRRMPSWWYQFKLNPESTTFPSSSYLLYDNAFYNCYVLSNIENIPVWTCEGALTSNVFSSTFSGCYRLTRVTFETNPDGSPIEANWKSQVITLSDSGYLPTTYYTQYITDYNSGITVDKMVTDATTYQALKDDPDWFGVTTSYSRYNKASAIATINSLPDTSAYLATAGGTNTIKFKGTAGESTDGGRISHMTEEEIAVATAKGWTVTFV